MEEVKEIAAAPAKPKAKTKRIDERILDFLSSVRFGLFLLGTLIIFSVVGMVIVQQNVSGFDSFYASLMPAERLVYGWLGFFNIYTSWYY